MKFLSNKIVNWNNTETREELNCLVWTMPKRPCLCGAETRSGGTCRNRVIAAGDRCSVHCNLPLSAKGIMSLCYQTIEKVEKVAALATAWSLLEQVYPHILRIANDLSGLLMPEYFWELGFKPRNHEQMSLEIQAAHKNRRILEKRYKQYPPKDKLSVEHAYRDIINRLLAIEPGA